MPRQRDADEEDMMATCPRCKGSGQVYRIDLDAQAECPLCSGTGRVTQYQYERYMHGPGV